MNDQAAPLNRAAAAAAQALVVGQFHPFALFTVASDGGTNMDVYTNLQCKCAPDWNTHIHTELIPIYRIAGFVFFRSGFRYMAACFFFGRKISSNAN